MHDDHLLAINPIVSDSVMHNQRVRLPVLPAMKRLTSDDAGSQHDPFPHLTSTRHLCRRAPPRIHHRLLIYWGPAERRPERYFGGVSVADVSGEGKGPTAASWREMAFAGVGLESFMGFVLTWTLIFNLVGT